MPDAPAAARLDAVRSWELGLHEDEIRVEHLGGRDRLPAVSGRSEHEVTAPLELRLQAGRDEALRLDDEDAQPFQATTIVEPN